MMSWGASTIRLKNRLAQLAQTVQSEGQFAMTQSQVKLRLKSVNQLARCDGDFMPVQSDNPHPFEHCLAQTQYIDPCQVNKNLMKWQGLNPQQDRNSLAESQVRKVRSQILPDLEKEFDSMSVFRCRSQIQTRKYCYDCDESTDRYTRHKCMRLSTLTIIDHRLKQLQSNAGNRMLILVQTGRKMNTSMEIRSLIGTLKSIKNQQLDEQDYEITVRLINLLSKKLGWLLNKEQGQWDQ